MKETDKVVKIKVETLSVTEVAVRGRLVRGVEAAELKEVAM